jgi:hypothetical protein
MAISSLKRKRKEMEIFVSQKLSWLHKRGKAPFFSNQTTQKWEILFKQINKRYKLDILHMIVK